MMQSSTVSLDDWNVTINFLVILLDNFQLILGINFLTFVKIPMMPHLVGMLIKAESHLYFVVVV